jgi:serine/threonine-protein kinase
MNQRLAGRYQIVREIGAGGMGNVFLAIDTETGREVAAKVMIATGQLELQSLLRFQQEGAVLATLKHPNIVTVYGTFLEEHTCAIIMELLSGGSLRTLMEGETLSLARTRHIILQVLAALEYAHGRGIIHRDIKPDNVMLTGEDAVKVTDFGIARVLGAGGTLNTATGTSIGTPLYMSPEQIEGQKVDGRSDLYSLGAICRRSRSKGRKWTAAPTCTRWAPCCIRWSPAARPLRAMIR